MTKIIAKKYPKNLPEYHRYLRPLHGCWNQAIDEELEYREGCYLIPNKLFKSFSQLNRRSNQHIEALIERSKWR